METNWSARIEEKEKVEEDTRKEVETDRERRGETDSPLSSIPSDVEISDSSDTGDTSEEPESLNNRATRGLKSQLGPAWEPFSSK